MVNRRPANFLVFLLFALSMAASVTFAQQLPKKIRGYKVHDESIAVVLSGTLSPARSGTVKMNDPDLVDVGLDGAVFEMTAEILSQAQSGKIDFLTFHNVTVNGIGLEVEEYVHTFSFKKSEPFSLPKPVRVTFPVMSLMKTAWEEAFEPKREWNVKGRVFLFGKFKRFGFYHKRVIPVDFAFEIPNPLI